jgi:hypothetical protein
VLLLVQLLIGLYEIDQTPQFGHQGYHVAEHGLGARNLDRWGTLTHTAYHGPGKPPEASLNFHHLTMLQVPVWITQSAFGDQSAWPVRVVGLFFSLAATLGIWLFARKARGLAVAVVVAAAFVFNPLHVAFGNLPDIQMVSIAWLSWAGVALLALFERPTWLRVGLLWLCVAAGALADWAFYPVIFLVVSFVALRVRPYTPLAETLDKAGIVRIRIALFGVCLVLLLTLGQHAVRAHFHGQLDDLLGAHELRSDGAALGEFVGPALGMLAFSHTKFLLILGALWLVWSFRAQRADLATRFVAAVFIGQTIYMLHFQNEFWVHEYRSYWYVMPLAFAAGDVAGGVGGLLARAFRRPGLTNGLTLLLGSVSLLFVLAEAIPMLKLSRVQAGSTRFDGYDPRLAQMVAARAVQAMTAPGTSVVLGPPLEDRLELHWLIDRPSWEIASPGQLAPIRDREGRGVLFHSAETVRGQEWARHVRDGRVLLIDDYAIVEFGPDVAPSVESARHMIPPIYRPIERWLKAADGPTVLVPGAPDTAAAFARDIGAKEAVIEHALAGETPVLDALPDELALQRVPPSRLAFTRRVGGRGGNESTAQCWGPRAVSQIVAAHPPERPDRLAWVQPFCRDVAKKGEHLDVVAAPDVGPRFGLPDGRGTIIHCPDSMVPVGVSVRADSLVNQISLLCAEMRLSSPTDPVKPRAGPSSRDVSTIPSMYLRGPLVEEGAVGGEVGDAHKLVCPADSLLFGLVGRTGALVHAIGLSCIAIEAVLSPKARTR